MAAEDTFAIGLAVGMEHVDGTMHKDTSWTTAVCIKNGATQNVQNVEVVAKAQALSHSTDVFGVITDVLRDLLKDIDPASVTRVNIATPQVLDEALNNNVTKVTAVRLCGTATQSLPPFVNIPEEVKEKLKGDICLLNGGYEYSRDPGANPPIKEVNTSEVLQCIADVGASDYDNVVICGVYSPDNAQQEYQVGQLFEKQNPNLNVTLSHKVVNQIGLLERENTSILNAGLGSSFQALAAKFKTTFNGLNLVAPFYFVQNEANVVSGDDQEGQPQFPFPVKSFFGVEASTMNSSIVLERDLKHCIVINIQGVASTAGIIKNGTVELQTPTIQVAGFPIYKHTVTSVTHNIGMFSKVHNPESDSDLTIGPDSVATSTASLVFGGQELTVLDVAVKANLIQIGDPSKVDLDAATIMRILEKCSQMISSLIDSAKDSPDDLPVVIVGIGNVLINGNNPLAGASKVIKPPHAEVATAIGAAVLSDTTLHFAGHVYFPMTDPLVYLTHERHVFRHPTPRPRPEVLLNYHRQMISTVAANKSDDPIIVDGEWLLQEIDLEYISIGAGILGSGGGGSPLLGKLMAIEQLDKGKKIRVKVPERMSDNSLAVITAMMGSPGVLLEKYPNGSEGIASLTLMEDLYKCGYDISDCSLKWKPAGTVEAITEEGVKFIEDFPTVYNSPISEQTFEGLLAVESGGVNTMQVLIVGAETDKPVFDCDGQGRSVPDLQMLGPIMNGTPIYPTTLTGDKGQRVVALSSKTAKEIENFFRIQTVKMGSISAITLAPLTKDIVKSTMVNYTISKSWRLGKAIKEAQQSQGGDPIQSILDSENGKILMRDGKVTSLLQTNLQGFTVGRFTVSNGSGAVTIDYQNENLVAWEGTEADPTSNEKVLATTPDLISLVDNNGQPLTTELLYYGVRLTVIAMPCSPLLTTETALKFIGPQAVGYDFGYKQIGGNPKYKPAIPVPPLPN